MHCVRNRECGWWRRYCVQLHACTYIHTCSVQYSIYTTYNPTVAQWTDTICHFTMCLLHFTAVPWPSSGNP
jgi:hypothetical protein